MPDNLAKGDAIITYAHEPGRNMGVRYAKRGLLRVGEVFGAEKLSIRLELVAEAQARPV